MSEPCNLSAVDARDLIGSRKLPPMEFLNICIDRIEQADPVLNAFPFVGEIRGQGQ